MLLGEIGIDVTITESSIDRSIQQLKDKVSSINSLHIKAKTDTKELHDLNTLLDKKVSHLKETREFFKNNPITGKVKVDKTDFEKIQVELGAKTGIFNFKVKFNIDRDDFVNQVKDIFASQNFNVNTQNNSSTQASNANNTVIVDVLKRIETAINKGNAFNPIKSVATGLFENLGYDLSNGIKNAIKNNLGFDLKKSTSNVVSQAITPFSPKTQNQNFLNPSSVIIPPYNQVAVNAMATSQKKASVAIHKEFTQSITQSLLAIQNEVSKDKPNIDLARQEFTKIKTGFKQAYASMQKAMAEGNEGLVKILAQSIVNTAKKAQKDLENITKELEKQGVPSKFGSELKTLYGSTKGVLTSRYVNPSKRVLTKIQTNEQQTQQFTDVGKNVVSGLTRGLADKNQAIREASEVSFAILNAMRKSLGIQSPSRRAWEIAMFIGQGMVGGLKESVKFVKNAASQLIDASMPVGENVKRRVKKAFPNLLPKTQAEKRAEEELLKNTLVDPLGMDALKEAIKNPNARNMRNFRTRPQMPDDAGSVGYFERLFTLVARKAIDVSERTYGKEKGAGVAKQAGAALAMTAFPGFTAGALASPLALPLLPTYMGFREATQLLTPLVDRIKQALDEVIAPRLKLNNLAGSETGGRSELQYVKSISAKYGSGIATSADAYASMSFATKQTRLEGEQTKKLFEGINAAIRYVGANTNEASLIYQAFTQMLSKGKISMEELRLQLSEKFPPAMQVFAKAMKVSVPELTSLISKGALLSEDVLPKVADVLIKDFGNATTSAASAFVLATTRMQNAGFELSDKLTESYAGIFTGLLNLGAGVTEGFLKNFAFLEKGFSVLSISLIATTAAGFQTMLSTQQLATKLAVVQNLFVATFRKTFSLITPFLAATFIDLLVDVFGAKNSVFENMSMGVTNLFVAVFSNIDNMFRDFSGKSLFSVDFTEQVGVIDQIKDAFGGLFKIIPSGVLEMAALVLMFQQTGLLAVSYLKPGFLAVKAALGEMVKGIGNAVFNLGNIKDAMKDFFPGILNTAKNVFQAASGFFLNFAAAYGVLALAQSDFSDPLANNLNKNNSKIVDGIRNIGDELNKLKSVGVEVGKAIGDSIKNATSLPSKGLELNFKKVLGIEDESVKTDDIFKRINAGDYTDVPLPYRIVYGSAYTDPKALETKQIAERYGVGEFFSGQEKKVTLGQTQLLNKAKDLTEFGVELQKQLDELNLSSATVGNFTTANASALREIQDLDKRILALSTRRGKLGLINTAETRKEIRSIDEEIKKLLEQRGKTQKPLSNSLDMVENVKETLKKSIQEIENSDLPIAAKKALIKIIQPQLETIEASIKTLTEQGVYKLAKPLEEIWSGVVDKLRDADTIFNRLTNVRKIENLDEQTAVLTTGRSEGARRDELERLNIRDLEATEAALNKIIQIRKGSLERMLSISGVETNETRKEEVEKLRNTLEQDNLNLAQTRQQIAQAQVNLQQRLREQARSVQSYFDAIAKETEDQQREIEKFNNQRRANEQQSKIRRILSDGFDTAISQFLEAISNIISRETETLNRNADVKGQISENNRGLRDRLRQGYDLSQTLPGSPVPVNQLTEKGISVKLDFSGIADDSNIRELKNQITETTQINENLGDSFKKNNESLDDTKVTAKELLDQLMAMPDPLSQISEETDEIQEKTNLWQEGLNKITPILEQLKEGFTGLVGGIELATQQTTNWVASLLNVPGLIQQAGEAITSIGTTDPENNPNVVGSLLNLGQNILNKGMYGYASPSTTQSYDQVLKGSVGEKQGLFALRPGGRTHSGVDFDRTEGLGAKAPVNAMFPGIVDNTRTWGNGYADPVTGRSNAIRIKSVVPGNRGHFYVDYGHLTESKMKVQQGQAVQPGQSLGTLSNKDAVSSGGHLDLKIRVPASIAQNFKNKIAIGTGYFFVDVKEFMVWYRKQVDAMPQKPVGNVSVNQLTGMGLNSPKTPQMNNLPENPFKPGKYAHTQNKLSPQFLAAVTQKAKQLGTKPEYLLAVMGFETGGTYSPSKTNDLGFTGLIQFSPKYSPGNIGKTTAQLRNMSQLEQLEYVVPYINKNRNGKPVDTLEQLYMSVLMPSAMGKGSQHKLPGWAYRANKGLDIDKDGAITVAEATAKVRDYLKPMMKVPVNQLTGKATTATTPATGMTLQGTVKGAMAQTEANTDANNKRLQEQAKLEAQISAEENKRELNRAINNLNTYSKELGSDFRSVVKQSDDREFAAIPFPTAQQRYQKERKDTQSQFSEDRRNLQERIDKLLPAISQNRQALQQLDLPPEARQKLTETLAELTSKEKGYRQLLEKTNEQEQKTLAAIEARYNREQWLKTQRENLETKSGGLETLRKEIEYLEQIATINPFDKRNKELPSLREKASLLEAEISLQQQLLQLEEAKYNGMSAEAYEKQKQYLNQQNEATKERIALLRQEEEREQRLKELRDEFEYNQRTETINNKLRRVRSLDPKAMFEADKSEADLERQSALIDVEERRYKDPADAIKEKAKIAQLYQSQIEQAELNRQKLSIDNEQLQFDTFTQPRLDAANKKAESIKNNFGNEFEANAISRDTAVLAENFRYRQQLLEFELKIAQLRSQGIDVDERQVQQLKSDLSAINEINLSDIGNQFKTFGKTIDDIAGQSLKSLSQGLADVIVNGGSVGDVFGNMFNTILSGLINTGLNSLFGGIFGAGKIFGFSNGGDVPSFSYGGDVRTSNTMIGKALRTEGANSVLATLTPGERVLTVAEAQVYRSLYPKGILNSIKPTGFNKGGDIPGANFSNLGRGDNYSVSVSASVGDEGNSTKEKQLVTLIRSVVIAELKRQKQPGGMFA